MPENDLRSLPPRPPSSGEGKPGHPRRWPWMVPWLLGLAAAAVLGWMNANLGRELQAERSSRAASEAEVLRLRGETVQVRDQLESLQTELEEIAASGNLSAEEALRRQREMERTRRAQNASQEELETALVNSRAEGEVLTERIGKLEVQMEQLGQQLAEAKQREAALAENVAQSKRLAEALQAQLQGKDQALATLERSYQRFKDSSQSASRQLETISRTLTELEELNQRRARVLEQATRRLKDLSDSYRTVAVRIDSDPRTQGTLNAEVNRLQSSVLAVEDQVAQFNTLNTQASQLERRLSQLRTAN